jgi:hypothetical protein
MSVENTSILIIKHKLTTHRFEKKIVNRDADDSGFCVNIGVLGAEPRLHAFSYDVSVNTKIKKCNVEALSY